MRTPLTLLVPLLALLVTGCGGAASEANEPVAAQAERVGELIDDDRPCEALEAMRALDTLASGTGDPEVQEVVSGFISSARAAITCGAEPSPSPPPAEEAPPAREDEPPADRDDDKGKDKDDDSDDGPPGRGRGQGRG